VFDENDRPKAFERLWQKIQNIKDEVVQTVPEEIAFCEFDCRALSCSAQQWKTCERRIRDAESKLTPAA
jgi:hypothetical protein